MKFKVIITAAILQLSGLASFAQGGDAILGIWQSEHGSGRMQIYKSGSVYEGKLVKIKEPTDESGKPKVDINNPSEKLKNRPIVGLEVLQNFRYKNDGLWEDGTIYDPRSGKTYQCKLTMRSSDKLEIRAFIGFSLIGKSQVWSRVN